MKFKLTHIVPVKKPAIYIPTEQDIQLKAEPMVEVNVSLEECTDYYIEPITGVLVENVKSVILNGNHFHLKPGINKVPFSVRENLYEARDAGRRRLLQVLSVDQARAQTTQQKNLFRGVANMAEEAREAQLKAKRNTDEK